MEVCLHDDGGSLNPQSRDRRGVERMTKNSDKLGGVLVPFKRSSTGASAGVQLALDFKSFLLIVGHARHRRAVQAQIEIGGPTRLL